MKYINHHSLRNFNNVYMCVNIGFNECFDDTERIRACLVFVKEFNTKILNVRVCVHVSIGYNEHFKRWNDMQLW